MSTRVIDETTLRSCFPWVPEADLTTPRIAASSSEHSIDTIVAFKIKLFYTRSAFVINHTLTFINLRCLHEATWLNFVKIVELPDKNAISTPSKIVEGYELYPKGSESAGLMK